MSNDGNSTDLDVVLAARRGDKNALHGIVDRHARGVVSLLSRVLGDRELALDFTQETFLRVFRSLERFEPQRSLRAWILSIAWNLAIDEIRRRKRRREWIGEPRAAATGAADGSKGRGRWDDGFADPRAVSPGQQFEAGEERAMVHRALDALPEHHRSVLVLRDLEDLSYEEVAQAMGTNLGTVKSRLSRARLQFRDAYMRLLPFGGKE